MHFFRDFKFMLLPLLSTQIVDFTIDKRLIIFSAYQHFQQYIGGIFFIFRSFNPTDETINKKTEIQIWAGELPKRKLANP